MRFFVSLLLFCSLFFVCFGSAFRRVFLSLYIIFFCVFTYQKKKIPAKS